MTDAQLEALCGVLDVSIRSGRDLTENVMRQALYVASAYLRSRTAYRQCQGGHQDNCNSYMGWGDKTDCDCPHNTLKATLLNGGGP